MIDVYFFVFKKKKKKEGQGEKRLDRSIGRIKKRAVLMTFNFNYNMLCCVFFFFCSLSATNIDI